MSDEKEKAALEGDPQRQASDTIRAYVYQIWHSLHAWLELIEEEILFLEGAEDFDVIGKDSATAVQVKDVKKNITLRSAGVIEAINNYWLLRRKNPKRKILFRFLTRSNIGMEKGSPLGKNVAGIALWNECSIESNEKIEKLRSFLLQENSLEKEILKFLSNTDTEELYTNLIELQNQYQPVWRGHQSPSETRGIYVCY